MKDNTGIEFLNKVYKDLNNSEIVNHSSHNKGDKNQKVSKYMDRLERVTMDATKHNKLNLIKEFYYDKYIIKEENIPEAYFELQKKIALERGYGHLEYDKQTKKQEIEHIISEQKSSLEEWLNYFVSEETSYYPTWFKYYTFQGIIKLGAFDKEKGTFSKRTSSTVYPFIELNREAVAFIYSELIKVLGKEEIDDKELETLLNNGSFPKIYGYVIKKLDSINKDDTKSEDGIWKKYNKGSNPEELFNDIHGKGTGWCTAGGIETARTHINGGDFYVYYTKGSDGEYGKPRIAIRTQYGKIAEIRGVAEHQNLEANMEQVVKEKLEEFPDKEEYLKKVKDMEMMTYIHTKWQNKGELAKEDLRFIYETDDKIKGFGYQKDPRIQEIINTRNIKEDLSTVLDCKEENISLTSFEALKGNIIYHYGDLNAGNSKNTKDLIWQAKSNTIFIIGGSIEKAELKLPKNISGSLDLGGLTNAEGLELPQHIGGYLNLGSLTSAEGLKLPETIGGTLYLNSLKSAKDLELPKTIGENLNLNSLKSAEGLKLPETIGRNLYLDSLTSAESLELPQTVGGNLSLRSLASAESLELPQHIGGYLDLRGLTSAEGLKLPETIGGTLYLDNLTSAENVIWPEEVGTFVCPLFDNDLEKAKASSLKKNK